MNIAPRRQHLGVAQNIASSRGLDESTIKRANETLGFMILLKRKQRMNNRLYTLQRKPL